MSDYPTQLESAYTTLQTKKNLPELFCRFFDAVKNLPAETYSPEVIANVQPVFQDVNKAVEKYNQQFQILVQELGMLCNQQKNTTKFQEFFRSFLDLLRLAYSVYKENPEKLSHFEPLLQKLLSLFKENKIQLEQQDISTNALLLQVMNSAWALTNTRESMEQAAKETKQGGARKTRKQKRNV